MAAIDVTTFSDGVFKTVFSGMVLREFEARRVFAPLVMNRQVTPRQSRGLQPDGNRDPGLPCCWPEHSGTVGW